MILKFPLILLPAARRHISQLLIFKPARSAIDADEQLRWMALSEYMIALYGWYGVDWHAEAAVAGTAFNAVSGVAASH